MLVSNARGTKIYRLPPLTAQLYRDYLETETMPSLADDQRRLAWAELLDSGLVQGEPAELSRREFVKSWGRAAAAACLITSAGLPKPAAAASGALCQADCAGFALGNCIDCSSPACDGSRCCLEVICVRANSASCADDRPSGTVICTDLATAGPHQDRSCAVARGSAIDGMGVFCTQSGDTGFFYACCESC